MAYTNFKTLAKIEETLMVRYELKPVFDGVKPVLPSDFLVQTLETNTKIPLKSEKSRSELVVMPVLIEVLKIAKYNISVFSGENLNADATLGLNGECDFIITNKGGRLEIDTPVIQLVEAKKQDFDIGIPQCSAQMIGAKIFNEKHDKSITKIYGCVTTGTEWLFLKLDNNLITIDNRKYYLHNLPELLGVFQVIIDEYKDILD